MGEDIELRREGSQAVTFNAMLAVGFSFFSYQVGKSCLII